MTAMPWPYLTSRLLALLSLLVAVTGFWFVADWIETDFRGDFWLLLGSLFMAVALFGRSAVLMGLARGGAIVRPRPRSSEVLTGSGGSRVFVESFGPAGADTIVLTCGWGFDRSLWDGVIAELELHYQVFVWDPPGVGRSGRPFDNHYSIERFALDLDTVLSLCERPALLVGHGVGALAVLELCQGRSLQKVAGVVLLNGAATSPLEAAGEAKLLRRLRWPLIEPLLRLDVWLSPLMKAASWASYLNGTALIAARAGFGDNPPRHAVDRAALMASGQSPDVVARGLSAALDAAHKAPSGVRTPLLVVAGGRDSLVDPDACRRTAEAAPDGRFTVVEEAGHAGPLEAPRPYAAAIAAHARDVFVRAAERRAILDKARKRARSLTRPPEPKSWVADPDSDERPDDRGGEGGGWYSASRDPNPPSLS